jgi:hypothetical protein
MKESININKNMLKGYIEYFFNMSICIRRCFGKVVDSEDSTFNNHTTSIIPFNYEYKSKDESCFYENLYFLCSDGNINYDLKQKAEEIRKEFKLKLDSRYNKKPANKSNKRKPIDSRLRHECFKRDNYTCKECGATKEQKTLHCDHILPVSQGGTDELSNLQTLCDDCNLAKYNRCFKAGEIKEEENNGTTN